MASLTNLHDSQRNTVDTNTLHGAQDQVDASTFPQGAPQMPRAGWTGAMWAESTAAAQQGQAGAGGVGLQQQPPYAQPGHPGQQFSTQQQFPGQQPQYAQQPAQYAQPGQQIYDPNAQYQQQFTGAGPSQQPPYAGAPQYQYAQQYPSQQQQASQQFVPVAGPVYDAPGAQPPQAAYAGYPQQGGQPWNQQLGMAPGMQLQMTPTGQFLGARSEDKPVAPQRACTRCKRLKVRCEPVNGERPCKRCRNANAECETAPRKQRPKKADKERAARLAAEADAAGHRVGDRSQHGDTPSSPDASEDEDEDEDSDEWLDPNQTDGPSDGVKAPFQFIRDGVPNKHKHAANMTSPPVGAPTSPTSPAAGVKKDKDGTKLLRPGYFNPDPAASIPLANIPGIDKLEILGVLTTAEIDMLFRQFMSKMNPYMSMFDEKLHTVEYVKERSPFLLSVIAMIASRYYTNRPDAYVRLMDITKKLAGEAIINMTKSIEHVQAFILLSSYPAPDRKYSENKNWLYSGVAFRMATDLGLYKYQPLPAATETLEREALNRTRTWIICFYLDESMSAHFGRPATIARDDAVVKNAMNWWHANQGRYAHLHDVHLVVFVDLLRAFRTALEKVEKSKENDSEPDVDYDRICREFDEEVAGLVAKSNALFEQYTDRTNPVCVLRERMGDFTTQYSRLIIHSTAFQKGRHQTPELEQACLAKCLQSAFRVLEILMNDLASTGLLRYACDGYFWYASFASAFLLKFLGAEHHDMVDDRTREQIVIRVRELIEVLGSRAVAVDGSHPPKLFSRFLNGMLSKHVRQAKRVASSAGGSSAGTPRHADSVSTGGGTADEASDAGTFSPATPSSELGSTPATSPVTSTGSASSFGHSAHALAATLPDPSTHSTTRQWAAETHQPDLFGGGFSHDPWAIAHETLMEDVGQQEMFTGMFILDHPPWWTDPNLSIDMAAMTVAGAGDAGAGVGTGVSEAGVGGQESFASYDASQYSGV